MNRATLVRRFGPLIAVIAVQLLIIAAVPSKGPTDQALAAGGPVAGAPAGFVPGAEEGTFVDPTTGQIVNSEGVVIGSTGGPSTPGASGQVGTTGTAPGSAQAVAGSTAHCVEGLQFDPGLYFYAPVCVADFSGDNGGATYQGVTKDTIKVVQYVGNVGPAVDAILAVQGADPSSEERAVFLNAVENTINSKYELYGRKLEIVVVEGECAAVPPDYPCLRNEARQIVQQHKPFAIIWNTSLASPFFDELSAQKVMNFGGWHFRDVFNQQRRPYHWDVMMSGSTLLEQTAEWYCKRMHGDKARYAGKAGNGEGENPPTNDIRAKDRVLGVISTDDPENKLAINELKTALAKCGAKVEHEYYYAQDITRAEEQRRLTVAKMREAPEATTIICFCDLVAPIFLYQTCEEQDYYPEHVIVGAGFMDADKAAQAYDNTLPPQGHQFENAFGLSSLVQQQPQTANDATRFYRAGGGTGNVPNAYASASADLQYYTMVAAMIQGAGPNLTPANAEAGAFRQPKRGGGALRNPNVNGRSLGPNDYTWIDDMREVYWSTTKQSPFNGEPGTYVDINGGQRFTGGQFSSNPWTIPEKPR